jgi:hypothetical protein
LKEVEMERDPSKGGTPFWVHTVGAATLVFVVLAGAYAMSWSEMRTHSRKHVNEAVQRIRQVMDSPGFKPEGLSLSKSPGIVQFLIDACEDHGLSRVRCAVLADKSQTGSLVVEISYYHSGPVPHHSGLADAPSPTADEQVELYYGPRVRTVRDMEYR